CSIWASAPTTSFTRTERSCASGSAYQPDQQRRAPQFPVDMQRHALRDAARVSGPGWRDVLNPIELRANDVIGDNSAGRSSRIAILDGRRRCHISGIYHKRLNRIETVLASR